jgi:drug/metabolite transporter (DMT)-like permease
MPAAQNEAEPVPLSGLLLLASCVAIWGVNAVAFKYCTKPPHGQGLDPVFLTGLRFLIVAPCLALMVAVRNPQALRLEKGDVPRYLVFGFVAIVLGETLQPLALRYTSVANLTFLSHGTISLFTALWALVLFRQPIARTGWLGAAIALIGVGIVASHGAGIGGPGGIHFDADTYRGDAIAVFRSVEHSCYMIFLARWLQRRSVLQVTVYNCAFGALWLAPYVIYRGWNFAWASVTPLVWCAFAWTIVPTTLYGFLAWNWGLRRVGAVAATNMFYLLPVTAALAAWLILGEPVTAGQLLGGLVIVCGIVLLRWDSMTTLGRATRLPGWRPFRARG